MKPQSPHIFDVDEQSFQERVLAASHQIPMLVDFTADWCGPCRALAPVLERVISEFGGRVLLAKVDADENMKLCGRYALRGFPTVLLFIRGQEVARFSSARTPQFVRDFLAQHLTPSP